MLPGIPLSRRERIALSLVFALIAAAWVAFFYVPYWGEITAFQRALFGA